MDIVTIDLVEKCLKRKDIINVFPCIQKVVSLGTVLGISGFAKPQVPR